MVSAMNVLMTTSITSGKMRRQMDHIAENSLQFTMGSGKIFRLLFVLLYLYRFIFCFILLRIEAQFVGLK